MDKLLAPFYFNNRSIAHLFSFLSDYTKLKILDISVNCFLNRWIKSNCLDFLPQASNMHTTPNPIRITTQATPLPLPTIVACHHPSPHQTFCRLLARLLAPSPNLSLTLRTSMPKAGGANIASKSSLPL